MILEEDQDWKKRREKEKKNREKPVIELAQLPMSFR